MSDWTDLLDRARRGARLAASPVHGERHWRAVAALGIALAEGRPGVDARVGLAFGMLHDCRRRNEYSDPQHGPRAARDFAGDEGLRRLLGEGGAAQVLMACEIHTSARNVDGAAQPAVAACLDADRFTLGRVGTAPRQRYFSLDYDDFAAWVRRGEELTVAPPGWDALIAAVEGGQ